MNSIWNKPLLFKPKHLIKVTNKLKIFVSPYFNIILKGNILLLISILNLIFTFFIIKNDSTIYSPSITIFIKILKDTFIFYGPVLYFLVYEIIKQKIIFDFVKNNSHKLLLYLPDRIDIILTFFYLLFNNFYLLAHYSFFNTNKNFFYTSFLISFILYILVYYNKKKSIKIMSNIPILNKRKLPYKHKMENHVILISKFAEINKLKINIFLWKVFLISLLFIKIIYWYDYFLDRLIRHNLNFYFILNINIFFFYFLICFSLGYYKIKTKREKKYDYIKTKTLF